jgi:carboxy-terminal domain RNA polymerase II polypeptide A small phosphatase
MKHLSFVFSKIYDFLFKKSSVPFVPEKKILFLDLDETLVYSRTDARQDFDYRLEVQLDPLDVHLTPIYVLLRPHVFHFLEHAKLLYNVIFFTASMKTYADALLDLISPGTPRFYRESCTLYQGGYIKDIGQFGFNPKDMILLDNMEECYRLQPQNGLPIKSYDGNKNDNELLKLVPFLMELSKCDDVRPKIQEYKQRLRSQVINTREIFL